jgi:hypothetical protein
MTGTAPPTGPAQSRGRITARQAALIGALIVVAGAGIAVSFLLRDRGSSSTTTRAATSVTPIGPVAATPATLAAFAKALGRPIYWAGAVPGEKYEFTETSSGNVFVRYLPKGVAIGDKRASFRVIGTYPYPGALKGLRAVAKGKGVAVQGGGLAFTSAGHPENVHIAYPGVDYQVEVYDPVPSRARALARSGDVKPVG